MFDLVGKELQCLGKQSVKGEQKKSCLVESFFVFNKINIKLVNNEFRVIGFICFFNVIQGFLSNQNIGSNWFCVKLMLREFDVVIVFFFVFQEFMDFLKYVVE